MTTDSEALQTYRNLRAACDWLDDQNDHAIAAMVSQAMTMMERCYPIRDRGVARRTEALSNRDSGRSSCQ